MTVLHYVGFNGYQQCPKNDIPLPKVIADWISIRNKQILNVSCSHKIVAVETAQCFEVYGILNVNYSKTFCCIEKPAITDHFAACDEYLIASEKENIWKFSFKDSVWTKLILKFENKGEEQIWKEKKNIVLKFTFRQDITDVILLLSSGSVWKLSEKDELQILFPYDTDKAVDISSGLEHTLILTESGCIISLGNGRGQLGHGDLHSIHAPVQISALEGLKIVKIAAGGWHSCAITDSGDLCTWGWNNYGQLSVFDNDEEIGVTAVPVFVDVQEQSEVKVVDVACGTRHTVVRLENGDVYATGWNTYRQLGTDSLAEKISKFTKSTIGKINDGKLLCGPWYSVILEEEPND